MKPLQLLFAVGMLAVINHSAQATLYTDATGENFTAAGGGILDISSVEVTDTATDLIFKITLSGDPVATDWGKYMIGINSAPGGDTAGNGWGRPISISDGMDYWVGSWVDSGNGANLWEYTGSWSQQSQTGGVNPDNLAISKIASPGSVTVSFNYAGLGLSAGDTFTFDVYTSGGGASDGAVDALANSSQTIGDWGNSYNSTLLNSYTITAVPEPSAFALIGLGALVLSRGWLRRQR
jgi:hypothetical protein